MILLRLVLDLVERWFTAAARWCATDNPADLDDPEVLRT